MGRFHRHRRFLASLGFGVILALGLWLVVALSLAHAAILGFDSFALVYLVWSLGQFSGLSAEQLRGHADDEDLGMVLIVLLVATAVGISFWAIFNVLKGQDSAAVYTAFALVAVPLGWAMVQTVAGFHYAHLYCLPKAGTPMKFPDPGDPGPWDFLYFAFTIGMTAQVSDVTLGSTRLRRAVLLHSVLSFFYNTVILVLAVSAGQKLI